MVWQRYNTPLPRSPDIFLVHMAQLHVQQNYGHTYTRIGSTYTLMQIVTGKYALCKPSTQQIVIPIIVDHHLDSNSVHRPAAGISLTKLTSVVF